MLNFKKVVSIIVLFSFGLCSCEGDKDNGSGWTRRDHPVQKGTSSQEETCCSDGNQIPWGLERDRCIDPNKGVCYNTNIFPRDSSKGISRCCFYDGLDIASDKCVDYAKDSCYVDPGRYSPVATIREYLAKKYFEYGYDEEIKKIIQEVSLGMMSETDADTEAKKRISKMPKPVEINGEDEFEKEISKVDKPVVLVVFSRLDNPVCRNFSPTVNKLVSEYEGKVKICKVNVDVDANVALSQKHQIAQFPYPHSILFKNGKRVIGMVGDYPEFSLKNTINKALSNGDEEEIDKAP